MSNVTEQAFERLADDELQALLMALTDLDDELEVDLESGILSLEFGDGTKYVINSHRAARQIWAAAERSAWHFDPEIGDSEAGRTRWTASRTGDELWAVVNRVVGNKLGRSVELSPAE